MPLRLVNSDFSSAFASESVNSASALWAVCGCFAVCAPELLPRSVLGQAGAALRAQSYHLTRAPTIKKFFFELLHCFELVPAVSSFCFFWSTDLIMADSGLSSDLEQAYSPSKGPNSRKVCAQRGQEAHQACFNRGPAFIFPRL